MLCMQVQSNKVVFSILEKIIQMSHEKESSHFPLYWLVNRDPYNGLL